MKQNEDEWVEYKNVMDGVIERSGLHKRLFFDLRGNHDSFGVPVIGGSFDFFSKYSINGQMGRNGSVNSVTLEVSLTHSFTALTSSRSMKFVIYLCHAIRTNFKSRAMLVATYSLGVFDML